VFPNTLLVDYVRVYQGPDTAERFEASFVDDFAGWQQVTVPFSSFERSSEQPDGAPADGLGLDEVWGYGFRLPHDGLPDPELMIDKVRLVQPSAAVVASTAAAGPGSLHCAVSSVADGGSIGFDPSLAGQTVTLAAGKPLWITGKALTIDGSDAPGLTVSGGGAERVLIVDPGATANLSRLRIANGFGFDLAGGILNNGTLNLDHALVEDNSVGANAGDFWKGGGGIYNGGGSTLNLTNSTVRNNRTSLVDGGGVYGFFGSNMLLENSTISGNTAGNVGGGLRTLGNATIRNSTISGNASSAWHGGAIFHTDGAASLVNSTVAGNSSPAGTAAIFVGTFTAADATLTLKNTIVSQPTACFVGAFGAGTVVLQSDGHNVFTEGSCSPIASDQVVADALLGPLADNGGLTPTHLPSAGSPVFDRADGSTCPATDQRGVSRPQGPQCDVGSVELEP
jgi:hypothetical protein